MRKILLILSVALTSVASRPAFAQTISTIAGGVPNNVASTSAAVGQAQAVAFDSAGNYYIASFNAAVYKVDPTGNLTTIAGNGVSGFSGDGGPATDAELGCPTGVAVDSGGNLFIADRCNNVIRRVNASTKIITTVAGTGVSGYSGDGGQATAATLRCPTGIVLDSGGNLFIAEQCNNVVRRIDATSKVITTVAGNGTSGRSGDGGPATAARLSCPVGAAFDSANNMFIADECNNVIRRVDALTMVITTYAGNGVSGHTGDGGPAVAAALHCPSGVALDGAGNLSIADQCNGVIRRVDAGTKVITTSAGNGMFGYTGDGGPATAAQFDCPVSVTTDSGNNLFIADQCDNVVRRVDAGSQTISSVAGGVSAANTGEGGPATAAQLVCPNGVARDIFGNLFIADGCTFVVRRVEPLTKTIQTVAGSGAFGYAGDGAAATAASFCGPFGVTLDAFGDLFISDQCNHVVRRVDAFTQNVSTYAGNGTSGNTGDGGAASAAKLNCPSGVASDPVGNLFIADQCAGVVRRVDATTRIITTYAGNGLSGYSGDGGAATSARLSCPTGVSLDSAGNLFIADNCDSVVRRVDASTKVISTVAGTGTFGYSGVGGPATAAQLGCPGGVGVDALGNLFISDQCNAVVQRVDTTTKVISTYSGTGNFGFSGDGGPATAADLGCPLGVAFDAFNSLLFADPCDLRVREVSASIPPSITSSATAAFNAGTPSLFTVTTTGTPAPAVSETGALPAGINFVDNGNGTAAISGTPAAGSGGNYGLSLQAINGVGSPASQNFTLTVKESPLFNSPAQAAFTLGSAGSFTVTTTAFPVATLTEMGARPAGVNFVDNGDGTATLSGTPAAGSGGIYSLTLKASNGVAADATQSFTLTVTQAPAITSGASATFTGGAAGSFTISATGFPVPALTEVGARPAGVNFVDNGNGTATLSGTLAAGSGGIYSLTLKASNGVAADATQSFTLTVTQAPAITSGASATFTGGAAGSFTVSATGFPVPALTEVGARPAGVNFVDNGNGTATLSGTPAAGSGGIYSLTLKASNGVAADATQSFTLTVTQAPAITSGASATFIVGNASSFNVVAAGFPVPSLTETGALPGGVNFVDNGNGIATLSGTPAAGSGGTYILSIKAANGLGNASQTLTLSVQDFSVRDFAISASPASMTISSGHSAPYAINLLAQGGLSGTVQVSCTGGPPNSVCNVSPASVTLDGSTMATIVLGTPMSANHGTFTITLTGTLGALSHSSTVKLTVK